jgi:hypothetical protein
MSKDATITDSTTQQTSRPQPEDYGWEGRDSFDGSNNGWCIEGGEEAYEAALEAWEKANA